MNIPYRILLLILAVPLILSCEELGDIQKVETNAGGYYGNVESVTIAHYSYRSTKEAEDSVKVYTGKFETRFDMRGNIVSSIRFDEHDIITKRTFYKYEYNKSGRIAIQTSEEHDERGRININKSIRQYDSKGKLIRNITHHSDNISEEVRSDTTDYKYDSKGRCIEFIGYRGPHILNKTVNTYTSFDEISTHEHESHSSTSTETHIYTRITYTYNNDNELIEGARDVTHVMENRTLSRSYKDIYKHDLNGNLIHQDTYQDNRLVQTYECEYDSRNNLTKETSYNYVEGIKTPFTRNEYQITYRD